MAGELTIEQNADGTATINFPGGGQHTVSGGNAVEALQDAYGSRIGKVTTSDRTAAQQKAWRDETYGPAERQRAEEYRAAQAKAMDDAIPNINLTEEQVQAIIQRNGSPSRSSNHAANKIAISNAILGMSMGLSFDEATDMSADGGFYTMLKQGYADPNWSKTNGNSPTPDQLSTMGGKLRYLQSKLSDLTSGVVGSNQDTRDWIAAVTSGDAFKGLAIATSQMYGGVTVSWQSAGNKLDANGNDTGEPLPPNMYLVGGNGQVLRQLSYNTSVAYSALQSFGVRDTSWVESALSAMGTFQKPEYGAPGGEIAAYNRAQGYVDTFTFLKNSYNPWIGYENLFDMPLATLYTPVETTLGQTNTGTTTGTTATTTQQLEDTAPTPATSTPATPEGTPPVGQQTYPSYTLPQNYTGAGTTTQVQTPSMPDSIKEGINLYGTLPFQYTPTTTYTIGQGGVTGGTTAQQPQQYTVRQFRNASGLTTSITFVNGRPMTTIPSGFYPADQQPAASGIDVQTTSAFQTTQMPQAPSVAPPPIPASSQIAPPQVQGAPTAASANMGTATGYTPQFMATGGSVQQHMSPTNTQPIGEFAGFRPEALQRIANSMGYQGDMNGFDSYLQQNPMANQQMNRYMNAARKMAKGGVVKAQGGVDVTGAVDTGNATKVMPTALSQQYIPQQQFPAGANLPTVQAQIAKTPGLPTGATIVPTGTTLEAGQLVSPYSGQVSGSVALPTAQAATTAAAMPQIGQAAQVSTIESSQAVNSTLQSLQAAQGSIDPRAEVLAAQQTASSVGNVQAAQGNAILMDNPVQRQIQDGELISGAANAQTAAAFTEQIEAATATPSKQATVQGQLEGLMAQFEGGNTPAWAAGSMRAAMATLSARGLGASSMAGQAVIQAAMEAALPVAQMDAQTMASFEMQNLSNRQQRAMLAAQQRATFLGQEFDQAFQSRVANAAKISDVANMNFTAEQQVALENSRIANTMNLQNLNNRQAMVMAEAAALANLDMQNLNNRQQAAVQNAQNFLSMDMANLSNQQQTDLFKAQQRVQSLFTDQAAQNASQQFNASSQNQVDQFFASLAQQTAQFNATQANAQAQFNAGQVNTIERFNAEINNQRDQFNAQNRLIIDQSNAQWRREIATADTAAVNRANELNATALIGLSQSAYNNLWQYYRDNMEWAWTSAENERQRVTNIAIAQLQADASKDIQSMKQDYESSANFGSAVFKFLTTDISNSLLGGLFG